MIYWFSMYSDRDLHGFIETLVNNGYEVTISKPGRRIKAEVWKSGEKDGFMQELRSKDQLDQDGNREDDAGRCTADILPDCAVREGASDTGYSRG